MIIIIAFLLDCRQMHKLPGMAPDDDNPLTFLATALCERAKTCDDEKKYVLDELVATVLHHKSLKVAQVLLDRLNSYIRSSMSVQAHSLVEFVESYILGYFDDEEVCINWEIAKGEVANDFDDNNAAQKILGDDCSEGIEEVFVDGCKQ